MLGEKLTNEVKAWGSVAVIIVVISIIMVKFMMSNPGNAICGTSYHYNLSTNMCCLTNESSCSTTLNSTALETAGGVLSETITALGEPKNWVAIVLIAIIGFGVLYHFTKKRK